MKEVGGWGGGVELDILHTIVLDEVVGEVHDVDVITVDKDAPRQQTVQFLEVLTKSCHLGSAIP